MNKWEYNKVVSNPMDTTVPLMKLNELGMQGWQLVSVICICDDTIYYFKREVRQEQTPEVGD